MCAQSYVKSSWNAKRKKQSCSSHWWFHCTPKFQQINKSNFHMHLIHYIHKIKPLTVCWNLIENFSCAQHTHTAVNYLIDLFTKKKRNSKFHAARPKDAFVVLFHAVLYSLILTIFPIEIVYTYVFVYCICKCKCIMCLLVNLKFQFWCLRFVVSCDFYSILRYTLNIHFLIVWEIHLRNE